MSQHCCVVSITSSLLYKILLFWIQYHPVFFLFGISLNAVVVEDGGECLWLWYRLYFCSFGGGILGWLCQVTWVDLIWDRVGPIFAVIERCLYPWIELWRYNILWFLFIIFEIIIVDLSNPLMVEFINESTMPWLLNLKRIDWITLTVIATKGLPLNNYDILVWILFCRCLCQVAA